jgi:hypothetical protein
VVQGGMLNIVRLPVHPLDRVEQSANLIVHMVDQT